MFLNFHPLLEACCSSIIVHYSGSAVVDPAGLLSFFANVCTCCFVIGCFFRPHGTTPPATVHMFLNFHPLLEACCSSIVVHYSGSAVVDCVMRCDHAYKAIFLLLDSQQTTATGSSFRGHIDSSFNIVGISPLTIKQYQHGTLWEMGIWRATSWARVGGKDRIGCFTSMMMPSGTRHFTHACNTLGASPLIQRQLRFPPERTNRDKRSEGSRGQTMERT